MQGVSNMPRPLKSGEYIKNGDIYCSACNAPKTIHIDGRYFEGACRCAEIKEQREKQEIAEYLHKQQVLKLKEASDIGERFYTATFRESILQREHEPLIDYCNHPSERLDKGQGAFLWGAYGRGKTHAMACMLNELVEQGCTCFFCNFNYIVGRIKATYSRTACETEKEVIDFFTKKIAFLFIDDLGTEYAQDKDGLIHRVVYEVVNQRYNNNLPIIYSYNHEISDLKDKSNIDVRVQQRIYECCADYLVEFNGKNWRTGK